MNPLLDVVIATHNGSSRLDRVLNGYCRQEYSHGWRMVIIDNASTDDTSNVVRKFNTKLNILLLHVAKLGKNNALNAALGHITGDLVILSDDDAIPNETFLESYAHLYKTMPDHDVFCGRIIPEWDKSVAGWLLEAIPLGTAYGITKEGQADGQVDPLKVYGANMAVRRRIFEAGHTFNGSIGPCGKNYPMGSETEFCRRLAEQGHPPYYSSKPCVSHIIREHQAEPSWLLKRAFKNGRGAAAREEDVLRAAKFRLAGIPGFYLAGAGRMLGELLFSLPAGDRSIIFSKAWRLAGQAGRIRQALLMRKAENGRPKGQPAA